ncbi:MAG: 16S rRNA (guanine(527)-N(7))-methyltransferase RsmG [Methylophilaceae bacterium]|nr:16S rRNA (guanine(527)-N(7))-methyltransferase RsmG [Nitrosomonadales bacterium]NCV38862.1 16S rRNA (guanine(527)-N(7))-methyltransferase RsmG [Betaproteobacteria bacterium]
MNSLIVEGLNELGYENDFLLIEKLEIYLATLKKWNKVYNLTAINEDSEIITKHFFDSLSVNGFIQNSQRILDVGTGAGFPGLILALFNPDKSFVLVDGVSKKISFLQEMIGKLNLKNVMAVHIKVEEYKVTEQFDIIISRAFAEIKKMIKLTKHLIKVNGKFIAMKGPDVMNELDDLNLPFVNYDVMVPFLQGTRKIIEIKNS